MVQAQLVSMAFSLVGAAVQYLRDAGVPEDVIDSNWESTKQKVYSRPSENLTNFEEE